MDLRALAVNASLLKTIAGSHYYILSNIIVAVSPPTLRRGGSASLLYISTQLAPARRVLELTTMVLLSAFAGAFRGALAIIAYTTTLTLDIFYISRLLESAQVPTDGTAGVVE